MVPYPERLDMAPYTAAHYAHCVYHLRGVLVHSGSACSSGHYFSFVRQAGQWWLADDSYCSAVPATTALRQQAYILFYEMAECDVNKQPTPHPPPALYSDHDGDDESAAARGRAAAAEPDSAAAHAPPRAAALQYAANSSVRAAVRGGRRARRAPAPAYAVRGEEEQASTCSDDDGDEEEGGRRSRRVQGHSRGPASGDAQTGGQKRPASVWGAFKALLGLGDHDGADGGAQRGPASPGSDAPLWGGGSGTPGTGRDEEGAGGMQQQQAQAQAQGQVQAQVQLAHVRTHAPQAQEQAQLAHVRTQAPPSERAHPAMLPPPSSPPGFAAGTLPAPDIASPPAAQAPLAPAVDPATHGRQDSLSHSLRAPSDVRNPLAHAPPPRPVTHNPVHAMAAAAAGRAAVAAGAGSLLHAEGLEAESVPAMSPGMLPGAANRTPSARPARTTAPRYAGDGAAAASASARVAAAIAATVSPGPATAAVAAASPPLASAPLVCVYMGARKGTVMVSRAAYEATAAALAQPGLPMESPLPVEVEAETPVAIRVRGARRRGGVRGVHVLLCILVTLVLGVVVFIIYNVV